MTPFALFAIVCWIIGAIDMADALSRCQPPPDSWAALFKVIAWPLEIERIVLHHLPGPCAP